MYDTLLSRDRAQRAILDAYMPDWESLLALGKKRWIENWRFAARVPRATAQRWYEKARDLAQI